MQSLKVSYITDETHPEFAHDSKRLTLQVEIWDGPQLIKVAVFSPNYYRYQLTAAQVWIDDVGDGGDGVCLYPQIWMDALADAMERLNEAKEQEEAEAELDMDDRYSP